MRITFNVSVLVMYAMHRDPEERSAFQRQRGENREKVLNPFVGLVSAMGEQAVISHADAEAAGYPPEQHGHCESLPAKHKKSDNGADMKGDHEEGCDPVDG